MANAIMLNYVEPSSDISFSDYVKRYYLPENQALSPTTRSTYISYLKNHVCPSLGPCPMNAIRHHHIQQMINICSNFRIASTSRQIASSVLSHSIKAHDLIEANPAICASAFQYPSKVAETRGIPQGVILERFQEIESFLDSFRRYDPDGRAFLYMALGLCMGLRPEERVGLDADKHIDHSKKEMALRQAYVQCHLGCFLKGLKTEGSIRNLPIPGRLYKVLVEIAPKSGPLFQNRDGGRCSPNYLRKRVAAVRKAANLPRVTPETCCHSFATASDEAGVDLKDIQWFLGHSNLETTLRYIKKRRKDLHDAMSKIPFYEHVDAIREPMPEYKGSWSDIGSHELKAEPVSVTLKVTRRPARLSNLERVYNCVRTRPESTIDFISDKLLISRSTVKRCLDDLSKAGVVSRHGSKKTGRWEIERELLAA